MKEGIKCVISVFLVVMLGLSTMPVISFTVTANAQSKTAGIAGFSCGGSHTGIWKDDGSLWMTGCNDCGQLGDGTNIDKLTPVKIMDGVKSASCGGNHTGILKNDGSLWMTGDNGLGQLGNGKTGKKSTPIKIMGGVKAVSCGYDHTGILKDDGTLWMTGCNWYGQIGNGKEADVSTPVKIMDGVKAVSCGSLHTGILKNDGSLWMTGCNDWGQLGDGTYNDSLTPVKIMDGVKAVSCGASHTGILKNDGSLWMTGFNDYGQLGDGTYADSSMPEKIMDGVKAVSCGGGHTGILKNNGSLWITGENDCGQLGDGNLDVNRLTPGKIMDDIKIVNCGFGHTGILKSDGSLWMSGDNEFGALGDGTKKDRATPVRIIVGGEQNQSERKFKFFKNKTRYINQGGFQKFNNIKTMLKNNMDESCSAPIPGIIETKVNDGKSVTTSREYVPQGLCKFGNYYIVTAYDHSGKLPSVFYVLDRSWKLLTTVTIGDYKFHNGGIAYDSNPEEDVLWFCGNTNDRYKGEYYVYRLKGSVMREAIKTGKTSIHINSFSRKKGKNTDNEGLKVYYNGEDNKASCLDYYDGRLWIGTSSDEKPLIIGYKTKGLDLNRDNRSFVKGVGKNMNGFTFEDGKNLFISYSLGRKKSHLARIIRYDVSRKTKGSSNLVLTPKERMEMPKMNEEILIDRGKLYVNFESAAHEYSYNILNRAHNLTDRIVALPVSLWHSGKSMSASAGNSIFRAEVSDLWDGSRTDMSFSCDPSNDILYTDRSLVFTAPKSGMYTLRISDPECSDNYPVLVTAEVIDEDKYYGYADTSTADSRECNVFLTVGKKYIVELSIDDMSPFTDEIYEADEDFSSYSGRYSLSLEFTDVADTGAEKITDGGAGSKEVNQGGSACFRFIPEESGVYKVKWIADGDLNDITILEEMSSRIEMNGDLCELDKGKAYYFISSLNEAEDVSGKGNINFNIEKIEEASADANGKTRINEDAVVEYTAIETGCYIIRVTNGGVTNMTVFDESGEAIAMGDNDLVFDAVSGEKYRIMCSGCKEETALSIEKYKTDAPSDIQPQLQTRSNSDIIIDLPSVKISKPRAAKKSAVIKWKKITKKNLRKIKKIQIQYSTDKTFRTNVKTVTAKKTAGSKKIKKLKAKKTYYVRVRAYRKVGNVTHVSKWSAVKKVRVK